ncbi:Rossmann-fold NAD(P)-binding domain-containing protein [Planomicrobium okeanokoites]|uniref:Short-chain dehydrogenase n=1 Tax=Planomicrobium okeanokoites TaxID=244 RepID=A0ABV7KST1_PLAOK|nr:short-chain dehydrogenase [Planomicrobium okeanokoites]TAA70277.1 short-chain dehydrogenase [Planomicrobium okeanokoites]
MKHALVIGGTGMLAQTSVWLSHNGYRVSAIGRNLSKMQRLVERNPEGINSMLVDYKDTEKLAQQLAQIQQKNGPIQLVLAWIHSDGRDVIPCLISSLQQDSEWKLFHVNGSSSNLEEIKAKASVPSHVHYYQIQLGFKLESGTSRWLTNDEISTGVIEAIRGEKAQYVVGTLSPWERRP